jgi:predicted DNA-binding transcriptional regulator AlpA
MVSLAKILAESPDLIRERLLNSVQSAELLNISVPHFRRMYRSGKIPAPIKIGDRKYAWRLGTLIDLVSSKSEAT